MLNDIESVLLSEEQLKERVGEIGRSVSKDYAGKDPILIGVLKGSFVFMADLLREISIPCFLDFISISSYGNNSGSGGVVKIHSDLRSDIANRHVIIVEDILDSGFTLKHLVSFLSERQPASIAITALLDKPARRRTSVFADYVGFEIPDSFVVGYGLDFAERYRSLPYIGILKPEIYSN